MANWCYNKVLFIGKKEQINTLGLLFNKGQYELSGIDTPSEIRRFFSTDTVHGYFRDYTWEDGYFWYETKYVPFISTLIEFAEMFEVGFIIHFYEPLLSYYGRYIYEQGELTGIELVEEDLNQYEYDKLGKCYLFDGQKYESDTVIIDTLLKRKLMPKSSLDLNTLK